MKQTLSILIVLLLCVSTFSGCDSVLSQNGDSQTTDDTLNTAADCEHNWERIGNLNESTAQDKCTKCGETRLYTDPDSINPDCEHDWERISNYNESTAQDRCTICGETRLYTDPDKYDPIQPGGTEVHDAFDIRISWANWLDGTIVDEGCLNFDQLAISSVHHIPLHKFSSRSELDAFKARFGEDNNFDYGYNGKSFNENTADYDDAFFDENDLFLVYVDANSGSFSFDVNNIFNDGKSFGIYVNQTNNPEDVTDDMAGWFITVAVPKSATENCTLFDAIMGFPPCIDSNNSQSGDNNNYVTIGTTVSDVMPPYAISCKIPTEYSTDNTNIPIILSFGLVEGCDADTDNYSEIVLRAENDEGHTIIIKRINISEIIKSEYFVESVWDDNREWIIGFNYTHKESFALPLPLFSGTSGQIHIGLYECSSVDAEDNRYGSGAYIVLSYTRNESSLSISAEVVDNVYNAVILKDGFTFNESWLDSNNELNESKTFVIESQEALDEIFADFKKIDFDKEMVIVYCYTTIYVREQKLEKVSFDNNILSIEFDVVDGKPGTGDATAPQTRTCVICLDKVAANEVIIKYNGQ